MSIGANSFYAPRIRSHTRLIDTISHVSEDGESDIVVVGHPAGGDGSDIEGMSDDESEGKMPEEVACLMENMHREMEEPSNLESERTEKKGRQNIVFGAQLQ